MKVGPCESVLHASIERAIVCKNLKLNDKCGIDIQNKKVKQRTKQNKVQQKNKNTSRKLGVFGIIILMNESPKIEIKHPETGVEPEEISVDDNITAEKSTEDELNKTDTAIKIQEKIISGTTFRVNEIRHTLGLEGEIIDIPSVELNKSRIEDLQRKKTELERQPSQQNESLVVLEPFPEESEQEYIARFFGNLTDRYTDRNKGVKDGLSPWDKLNYPNVATNQAQQEFIGDEDSRKKFLAILEQLITHKDIRQTPEKDKETLQIIERRLSSANNSLAVGEEDEKRRHFANTNQTRKFFEKGPKRGDDLSYSLTMFGIPGSVLETPEGKKYMHGQIDDKNIFLFGGGDSIRDLLVSEEYHPNKVINFDPYIRLETVGKNKNGVYTSEMISATSPEIQNKVASGELPKADEIWATYSVPFYLDGSQDISNLIDNMTSVLADGGNARISPIMIQGQETEAGSFETRKTALLEAIKAVMAKGNFNVTVFNNTIQIHKIKVGK